MSRIEDELRRQALKKLEESEVLMRDGHFDYGNGFHGRVYLNPHQLFRHPSTIWRLAQDLLDVLPGICSSRPRSSPDQPPAARCWRTRSPACSTAAAR